MHLGGFMHAAPHCAIHHEPACCYVQAWLDQADPTKLSLGELLEVSKVRAHLHMTCTRASLQSGALPCSITLLRRIMPSEQRKAFRAANQTCSLVTLRTSLAQHVPINGSKKSSVNRILPLSACCALQVAHYLRATDFTLWARQFCSFLDFEHSQESPALLVLRREHDSVIDAILFEHPAVQRPAAQPLPALLRTLPPALHPLALTAHIAGGGALLAAVGTPDSDALEAEDEGLRIGAAELVRLHRDGMLQYLIELLAVFDELAWLHFDLGDIAQSTPPEVQEAAMQRAVLAMSQLFKGIERANAWRGEPASDLRLKGLAISGCFSMSADADLKAPLEAASRAFGMADLQLLHVSGRDACHPAPLSTGSVDCLRRIAVCSREGSLRHVQLVHVGPMPDSGREADNAPGMRRAWDALVRALSRLQLAHVELSSADKRMLCTRCVPASLRRAHFGSWRLLERLPEQLQACAGLRSLAIDAYHDSALECATRLPGLAPALTALPALDALTLCSCCVVDAHEQLAQVLAAVVPHGGLTHLELFGFEIVGEASDQGVPDDAVPQQLRQLTALRTLCLDGCRVLVSHGSSAPARTLANARAALLGDALSALTRLQTFSADASAYWGGSWDSSTCAVWAGQAVLMALPKLPALHSVVLCAAPAGAGRRSRPDDCDADPGTFPPIYQVLQQLQGCKALRDLNVRQFSCHFAYTRQELCAARHLLHSELQLQVEMMNDFV